MRFQRLGTGQSIFSNGANYRLWWQLVFQFEFYVRIVSTQVSNLPVMWLVQSFHSLKSINCTFRFERHALSKWLYCRSVLYLQPIRQVYRSCSQYFQINSFLIKDKVLSVEMLNQTSLKMLESVFKWDFTIFCPWKEGSDRKKYSKQYVESIFEAISFRSSVIFFSGFVTAFSRL